jgi:hypothetical protein
VSKFDPGAGRDNDCVCASPCQPRQRDLPSIIYFEQFVDSSLVGTLLVSQLDGDFQALPAVALNNQAIRRRNVNSGIARSNRYPAGKITRIRSTVAGARISAAMRVVARIRAKSSHMDSFACLTPHLLALAGCVTERVNPVDPVALSQAKAPCILPRSSAGSLPVVMLPAGTDAHAVQRQESRR